VPIADRDASGIGSLADPLRRRLYLFVCGQPTAVSREQAADAVGVPVHQAKFHLDKLESEGMLETEYARLGGKRGPGAGRTSKLYRRAAREIAISLPDREYELAGRLMADAIAESARTGTPVVEVLNRLAGSHGRSLGEAVLATTPPPGSAGDALTLASEILRANGYEPRREDGHVILVNCPFHALAQAQTELVCQMNHALICGLTKTIEPYCPEAELEPETGRCCVVLRSS
jgi:predicted ArsR family transcriptional regulator